MKHFAEFPESQATSTHPSFQSQAQSISNTGAAAPLLLFSPHSSTELLAQEATRLGRMGAHPQPAPTGHPAPTGCSACRYQVLLQIKSACLETGLPKGAGADGSDPGKRRWRRQEQQDAPHTSTSLLGMGQPGPGQQLRCPGQQLRCPGHPLRNPPRLHILNSSMLCKRTAVLIVNLPL